MILAKACIAGGYQEVREDGLRVVVTGHTRTMVDVPPVPPDASGCEFTTTRWSQVLCAGGEGDASRLALEWLCRAYWEPLRRHAQRRGWRDAEDCVQEFWLQILERGALTQVDQERGRFRSWLLASLEHHLADAWDHAQALKRGGGQQIGSLEGASQEVSPAIDPTTAFDRAWAETVLARARARLAHEHQDPAARSRFAELECFLDANGAAQQYAALAERLGLSESAVKVAVHRLRSRLRACVRMEIAQTLAQPSEQAIDAELGDLLAALGGSPEKSGNRGAGTP